MKLIKKTAGKVLQALRNIANEHASDVDAPEIFAVGAVLTVVIGLLIYAIYRFIVA